MKRAKNLIFVRHAQSAGNIITGDERAASEIPNHAYPLTELGRKQAEITGAYLKERYGSEYFELFLNSSYKRTAETMDIILGEIGRKEIVPISDSRLDEKWDGIFHELSEEELKLRYSDQIRLRKRSGYYHYRAPGGQNCPDVELQIRSFISERCTENFSNILIVGHGRWFLLFQKVLHDLSVERFLDMKNHEKCDNASVSVFSFEKSTIVARGSITPWRGKIQEVVTECA